MSMETIALPRACAAGELTYKQLGTVISLTDFELTTYEGVLSYLSFDLTRDIAERVAVAISKNADPLDDAVFYLHTDQRIILVTEL